MAVEKTLHSGKTNDFSLFHRYDEEAWK